MPLPFPWRQPPVHSPVAPRGLLRGVAALGERAARDGPGRPGSLAELEELLRARFGATGVRLTGSGTQALQLALGLALRGRPGERPRQGPRLVALPAFCCFDVATAAVGAGADVVLYDVEPATLAPDPASLEKSLQHGATAAVVAPLFGVPVPWPELRALADRFGAVLIEDAAQGHGAELGGRPLGALGALAVLSFGRGKGWTGGGGGALLLREGWEEAAGAEAEDHGQLAAATATGGLRPLLLAGAQWAFSRPALFGLPAALPWLGLGETRYRPPETPSAMPAGAASLLLASREASDREASRRRETGARYLEAVARGGEETRAHPVAVPEDARAGYLRFPVRIRGGLTALADPGRALRAGLAPTYPDTLAALAPLAGRLRGETRHPGAAGLVRDLVTLPTHGMLGERGVQEVLRVIHTPEPRRAG